MKKVNINRLMKVLSLTMFSSLLSFQVTANNDTISVPILLKNGFEIKTMMHTQSDNTNTSVILQKSDMAYLCKIKIIPEKETGKKSICYKIR